MSRRLRIAVASGKGGTGKTTIATNLAVSLARAGVPTTYLDCDVEEPNGHLFLRPTIERRREVSIPVPEVDESRCTYCGACGEACRYSAILMLPKTVLTFPKLCHGCGGCTLACQEGAITEVPRPTGIVEQGRAGPIGFAHGKLAIGEAMAPPVIRAVLATAPTDTVVVIDAPPGTSCPVIESVKSADVVVLVTEPTPFGLSDLKLAVEMVRAVGIPFAVLVNRAGMGDRRVSAYCEAEGIPVLLEIPNDREIAKAYSRGKLAIDARPELSAALIDLHERLHDLAAPPRPVRAATRAPSPAVSTDPSTYPSKQLPAQSQSVARELVVISGKGGTGKTSIVASFCALAEQPAVADCDVDAADLHLVLDPTVRQTVPFSSGKLARIDLDRCNGCGQCEERCRFDAIRATGRGEALRYEVDAISCEGCGVCVDVCPVGAAALESTTNGEWFVSDTHHGPMVHARLGIAQENSGKLVSLVRREARAVAQLRERALLIADGSPGIGCPVIASIAGARLAVVVTEPTVSGRHDLGRVAELCKQLGVQAAVCINKADINPEVADEIEADASRLSIPLLGRIRYDDAVTAAQVAGRSVVAHEPSLAAQDIRTVWQRARDALR